MNALASVLANVLSMGLPHPRYIELHPDLGFIVFQFGGADDTGVAEVGSWATALGVPVDIDASDPEATWFSIDIIRRDALRIRRQGNSRWTQPDLFSLDECR